MRRAGGFVFTSWRRCDADRPVRITRAERAGHDERAPASLAMPGTSPKYGAPSITPEPAAYGVRGVGPSDSAATRAKACARMVRAVTPIRPASASGAVSPGVSGPRPILPPRCRG